MSSDGSSGRRARGAEVGRFTAVDKEAAYSSAEVVIIRAPADRGGKGHFFDTSAGEDAARCVLRRNSGALMGIKPTVPVGYTGSVRHNYDIGNVIFSIH